jgi:antigen flippase
MATNVDEIATARTERDYAWLIRNASGVGATNIVLVVLGVSQSILLARLLGPAGRGEVYIAVLTAAVAAQLVSLSAGAALQYHLGKGNLTIPIALGTIISFTAFLAVIAAIGVLAYLNVVPQVPASVFTPYIVAILGVLLITEVFNELVLPFFVAADMVKWRSLAEIAQRLLMLISVLILLTVAGRGVTGAIEAYVI